MEQTFNITISFVDLSLDERERDEEALKLLSQMKNLNEVEKVSRVPDSNPPPDSLGAGFLVGLLRAEVNAENAKKVFSFLGDRLSGKVIKLKVEVNGNKGEVEASSREELAAAIEALEKLIEKFKAP